MWMAFSTIIFIPYFIKIDHLGQESKRTHTYTHTHIHTHTHTLKVVKAR